MNRHSQMILHGILSQKQDNTWVIPVQGRIGVTPTAGTLQFSAIEDLEVTATGDVSISVAYSIDATYRLHTVTVNCANDGSGTILVKRKEDIVSLGNHRGANNPNNDFYTCSDTTAPIIHLDLNALPNSVEKIRQTTEYLTALTVGGNSALPTGLTYIYLRGDSINWTYNGALPTGLTYIYLRGNSINWTYNGALPTGLTALQIINAPNVCWSHNGAIPIGITILYLYGTGLDWTGFDIGQNFRNFTTYFSLVNFTQTPYSVSQLIEFLKNIDTYAGTLPSNTILRDYSNNPAVAAIAAATPNESGTDVEQARYWINQILAHEGIASFQLNTTNFSL